MNRLVKQVFMLSVILIVASCGGKDKVKPEDTADQPIEPLVQPETGSVEPDAPVDINPLDNPENALYKKTIYFDFDSSEVMDDFRETIAAHAVYLANNPQVSITLEGHCDERGTREYNLALGERRARAVRQLLIVQGVAARQLRLISYGEEKPQAFGHDEESWRQNRRVEFRYPGR